MVHGENKLTEFDYNRYYQSAQEDIMGLIQEYPFTKRVITPSVIPEPIILSCGCKHWINWLNAMLKKMILKASILKS